MADTVEMAKELLITKAADLCSLHQDAAAIRHDIGEMGSNVVGTIQGDTNRLSNQATTFAAADELRDFNISRDIGDKACHLSKDIHDGFERNGLRETDHFISLKDGISETHCDVSNLKARVECGFDGLSKEIKWSSERTEFVVKAQGLENQVEMLKLARENDLQHERTRKEIERNRRDEDHHRLDNANRLLLERKDELIELRADARHYRNSFENSQFQAVNNRLQALDSQLNETRQGVINFGTMSGNAGRQTSTENSVK